MPILKKNKTALSFKDKKSAIRKKTGKKDNSQYTCKKCVCYETLKLKNYQLLQYFFLAGLLCARVARRVK